MDEESKQLLEVEIPSQSLEGERLGKRARESGGLVENSVTRQEGYNRALVLSCYAIGMPCLCALQWWWGGMEAGYGTYGAEHSFAAAALRLTLIVSTSAYIVYFVLFLCKADLEPTVAISKIASAERGPWITGVILVLVNVQCIAWLQTNESPPETNPNVWKRWGVNAETRYGDIIAFSCHLFAIACIFWMIKVKKLVCFLIGTSYLVVHPLHVVAIYVVHKVIYPFNAHVDLNELNMCRENTMIFFYFALPTLAGLANAFLVKADYGYFSTGEIGAVPFKKIAFFFSVYTALPVALCAFLPVSPADKASMDYFLGDQGDVWQNGSNAVFLAFYFIDLIMLALVYFIAKYYNNYAFWRCFGICGMSSLRYLLTEQIGVAYARRTVNMSYSYGTKTITTYGIATLGDMLGYALAGYFFSHYLKAESNTYDGTLRLSSYKLFFVGLLPSFIIFAFPYPLTGYSMGYYFSFAEAFMYVFGVAVPAYHMWSYGVLRTFDINAIKERISYDVLPTATTCAK